MEYVVKCTESGDMIIPGNWRRLVSTLNRCPKLKEHFFVTLSVFVAANLEAKDTTIEDIAAMTPQEFDTWKTFNCRSLYD